MDHHKRTALQFRQRAEECRATARYLKDENARKVLLDVAADYERLAELQERLAELYPVERSL
jgi:hypothetical protein